MRQILEPLACLCKLGMLSYYKTGTKISIKSNAIHLQEGYSMQWAVRTWQGDNKDDISTLYNPILKAIEWYIFKKTDENAVKLSDEENEALKNIIIHAINGLTKLQETYNQGNSHMALL